MEKERRRSPRYPFYAEAHITEIQTDVRVTARTSELSRYGCYMDMMNPFPNGATVKIELHYNEQVFRANGKVIYSQPNVGMGVAFETIAGADAILNEWLRDLGGTSVPSS